MVLPFTEFKVWNSEQMEECIITKSNYYKKLKLEMKHTRFYLLVLMTQVQVMGTVALMMSRHMVWMKTFSFYLEYVIPIIIIIG